MRLSSSVALLLLALALGSCSSVSFKRDTPTSGTFSSSAFTFTVLSFDFPGHAVEVARANASDARQPNTIVTNETILPYLGPLDWLLDIISFRYASCEGTWGFPSETRRDESATQ